MAIIREERSIDNMGLKAILPPRRSDIDHNAAGEPRYNTIPLPRNVFRLARSCPSKICLCFFKTLGRVLLQDLLPNLANALTRSSVGGKASGVLVT